MKINKKKQSLDILSVLNVFLGFVVVGVCAYLFITITRYGEISLSLVLAACLLLLAVCLIVLTLSFSTVIFKKNLILKIATLILSLALIGGGSYGGYILTSLNKTIGNIVQNDESVDEMVTSYFIAYDNKAAKDAGSDYLNNKTIGIVGNDQILEGNILAKAEIDRLGLTVTYEEYENYQELLLGLFNGEIDVAAVAPSFASSFTTDDGQEDNLEKVVLVYSYDSKATVTTQTNTNVDLTDPFSVLIIGVDSMNSGNSDVLMLATFNPNTLDITLTSIARDSFVPISCYGGATNKINAARASRQCLINTVQDLLDVEINFFFETNFKGVVDIVDALGGIVINSEVEFVGQDSSLDRGNMTVWIPQGEYHANGEEVLAFIRERHAFPDGDFARQRHQQEVIRTLLEQILKLNDISKIFGVMEAAGDNISTNMSLSQIRELLTYCLHVYNTNYDQSSLIFDIQSNRITGYSSWTYNTRMEMRLWIYKLFKGSIDDNVSIIRNNLELTSNLSYPGPLGLDIVSLTRKSKKLPDWYNEKQEHEVMPAFVELFVNSNIKDMTEWANEHGLALNITYITDGDEGYNKDLENGTVLWQSVTSGRVALVSSIDVKVIKHPLDCSLKENANSEECKYTYINAVGKDIDTVVKWAKEKGITLSQNIIKSTDENYDIKNAGYVKSQTEKAYSKFNETMTLGVTYYEKIDVTFLDESGVEIPDSIQKAIYSKRVTAPSYSCQNSEHIFKGWTDLSTNSLFDFNTEITSKTQLQATCAVPVKHKVTFVFGVNGEHSQTSEVISGKAASAPEAAVTGYSYKWDKDFSNITSDLTITAIYEKLALVTFLGADGSELYRGYFAIGSTATYGGSTPTKASTSEYTYTFAGWNASLENIQGDTSFTAQFTEVKIEPTPEPTVEPSAEPTEPPVSENSPQE